MRRVSKFHVAHAFDYFIRDYIPVWLPIQEGVWQHRITSNIFCQHLVRKYRRCVYCKITPRSKNPFADPHLLRDHLGRVKNA